MTILEEVENVQDLMAKILLDSDSAAENETVQILQFVRENAVPINNDQAEAIFLLKEMGLSDIGDYVEKTRKTMMPFRSIIKFVEVLTMANRIKGTAKLNNVLKQEANPGTTLNFEKAAKNGGR